MKLFRLIKIQLLKQKEMQNKKQIKKKEGKDPKDKGLDSPGKQKYDSEALLIVFTFVMEY